MTLPTVLPVPTLDHVVINCRDRLDEGLDVYRRLGFQMTPRGHHSLGSMNHLAIFGTDYLELIAVPDGDSPRQDVMRYPFGLNGLVFGTEDSAATYAQAKQAGVLVEPPMEFSRPVTLVEGEPPARDAVFRTIHLSPGTVTAGRFYFCHHFTRDLVWRDAWRTHPNGAIGIASATIAATDPGALAAIFARLFGPDAIRPIEGGHRLAVGLTSFDFVTPAEVESRFGDAAPDAQGRDQYMAALTIRTRSLSAAEKSLQSGNIHAKRQSSRLIVPAPQAMGATLVFQE